MGHFARDCRTRSKGKGKGKDEGKGYGKGKGKTMKGTGRKGAGKPGTFQGRTRRTKRSRIPRTMLVVWQDRTQVVGVSMVSRQCWDKEFAEIIKNAWKKLEVQTALAMPCKRTKSRNLVTCVQKDDHKSRLTFVLDADESKRLRMEGIEPRIHQDHLTGEGDNSLHHYHLVHKFIPMPQALTNLNMVQYGIPSRSS